MTRKYSIFISCVGAVIALVVFTMMLTAPSWSSPANLFVTTSAPEYLPATAGTSVTLKGGGFSQKTSLWLVPERSIRSATTASLETFGNPHHILRRDDLLYVANGIGGFFIVEGLHSSGPSISGVLNSEGQGLEITLRKDEAIMAAGVNGLQIIDIRDNTNPQLLAGLKSLAPALSVANKGEIAYVATGKSGVQIVDVSNPRNPRHLGQLNKLFEAYKVFCNEKLLVVATGTEGLIYDLNLPTQPRLLAKLPVAGGVNTVMTLHGEKLYWATKVRQESHLYVIDLSQPTAPAVLTSAPLYGTPYGISCSDGQIAVALGGSGTKLFTLTSSDHLTLITTIGAQSRTRFALPIGKDLWVAEGGGELLRLDQRGAMSFDVSSTLPDFFARITPIVTPQLYLMGDETGLSIYDRMNDSSPILHAKIMTKGLTQLYLSTNSNELWLAIRNLDHLATGRLISLDISVPQFPRIIAEIPLSRPPIIIGESGKTLIIGTQVSDQLPLASLPLNSGKTLDVLHFIDLSQRESPSLISTYPLTTASSGTSLFDNYLALMQKDGLFRVIDLTEPQSPKELGSLQMPWLQTAAWAVPVEIVIKDYVAFISSSLAEISVIDMQNPRHPKNLGVITLTGPVNSLLTFDNFLFAETTKTGLFVIDLKNSREPELLGTILLPGTTHKYCIQGKSLWYVTTDTQGIWSLPLPHRLQNTCTSTDQISASIEQPPPGPYRLWLTDQQNHIVVPGVTWIGTQNPSIH